MRNAIRNTIAAALTATMAIAGITPANACDACDEQALIAPVDFGAGLDLVDSDGDGLPDVWEQHGVILSDGTAVPLPGYGADVNRPDLFLQLNWMASEYRSLGCEDTYVDACDFADKRNLGPSAQMLQEMVDLFNDHGINLHIDAGELFTNIPNYTPQGGETVDYNRYYFKDEIQAYKLLDNIDEFLGERDNIFRIGVIGDQIDQGNYASGISLVGDNSLFIANNRLMGSDAKLRNTIQHELGHTLDLRHWGANDTVGDLIKGVSLPMAPEYDSVMNYLYQFGKFNYSEKPYLLETPNGNAVVPADWDVLKINTPRIAADNLEIGDFSAMAGAIIDNKPEAPAKEENKAEAPAADKADDKVEAPAQVEAEAEAEAPAQADKANDKAEEKVQDQAEADDNKADAEEQDAPAKVDNANKQADNNKPAGADVNIAAIVAPIVALLAIVGIGFAFANMML